MDAISQGQALPDLSQHVRMRRQSQAKTDQALHKHSQLMEVRPESPAMPDQSQHLAFMTFLLFILATRHSW